MSAALLSSVQSCMSGTGGRFKGKAIQSGKAVAGGLKQVDGAGHCSYVVNSLEAKKAPNRLALVLAQEQRASLLMARILKWIDPSAYEENEQATEGMPRLTPTAPIVALWCTRAWVRAAHDDKLGAPILAIWADVDDEEPVLVRSLLLCTILFPQPPCALSSVCLHTKVEGVCASCSGWGVRDDEDGQGSAHPTPREASGRPLGRPGGACNM